MTIREPSTVLVKENPREWYDDLIDGGWVPDWGMRLGIRLLLRRKLRTLRQGEGGDEWVREREAVWRYVTKAKGLPITMAADKANAQHYTIPTAFHLTYLGRRLKYSACVWGEEDRTLDEAEEETMALYCARADIQDGQCILDLGCGWGSLTLYLAKNYPTCTLHALSNSPTQRAYIEEEARTQGLENITVHTGDVGAFEFPVAGVFDRVVSIEMLEHARNHEALFRKISRWLKSSGDARFFYQSFCHRRFAYDFEEDGNGSWMSRYFFSGGMMPNEGLFGMYQEDLRLLRQWTCGGTHYARTLNTWLKRLDGNREVAVEILERDLRDRVGLRGGAARVEARAWFERWRVFFMSCAEMFAMDGGQEWGVTMGVMGRQRV